MIKNNKTFQKIKHNRITSKYQKKVKSQTINFDIGEQIL